MQNDSIQFKRLIKKRDGLVAELSGYKYILRGTIIERGNICGKGVCRCKRKDNPILHGPYRYLSHRSKRSINMIFLTKKKLAFAKVGIREYDEAINLIYRIAEINFEILRYHYERLQDVGL